MQELETLLASLCKRGRKPKNREIISIKFDQEFTKSEGRIILRCNCKDGLGFYADLRWLVNLESGLWQFVCKNKLYKKTDNFWENVHKTSTNIGWFSHNHQYRLLESALIPEKELEEFLLNSIIVEGKKE